MTRLSLPEAAVNRFISMLLAIIMVSISFLFFDSFGNTLKAETMTLGLSDFISYYSSHIRNEALSETDASDYWETDENGVIKRINAGSNSNVLSDMAILYYDAAVYRDFTFEFDYFKPSGSAAAYAGFDGIIGKSWVDSQSGTVMWEKDGNGRYYGSYGTDGEVQKNKFGSTGNTLPSSGEEKWRHYKLTVNGGSVRFWVDDILLESVDDLGIWYDGGYLFIASNITGTAFKNISISTGKEDDEKSVCYYSSDITVSDPIAANTESYWQINDEDRSITRINSVNPGGEFKDIAIYYFDESDYRDFVLELDYYNPSGNSVNSAFVGFDSIPGKAWDDKQSGTVFWECDGYMRIRGSASVEGNIIDGWGNGVRLSDWEDAKWHHMKIHVEGAQAKVWVDDTLLFSIGNLGEWYDGGRLFVASNRNGVSFRNISVTSLNKEYTDDFTDFDSYYTENVRDSELVSAEPTDCWNEYNGEIVRKIEDLGEKTDENWNECNYHLGNMAYLFINGDYTEWDNYVFEIEYTHGTGAWGRTYIGFGASEPCTWRNENGGIVFYTDGSGVTDFEGNISQNGSVSLSNFGLKLESFDSGKSHKFRLECVGGIITIYVDGVEIKTLIENEYLKDGRIFIASNSTGAVYSGINFTEVSGGTSSFDGYDEWFGSNIRDGKLEDVDEGTNWAYYDGKFTRISEIAYDSQTHLDMAYLYFVDRTYTNFKIELDYKHGVAEGWYRAPVGFGAELGKHYMEEDGGIIGFSQPDGLVHFDGNVSVNGKFTESVWWPSYDDYGNDLTTISPYDQNEWHHLVLTVQDGYATMQYDDFGYIYEISLPSTYSGGYIYLCANSLAAQYKNIVIEDLDVNISGDSQAGWQPSADDVAFDFSFRSSIVDIAEWKYEEIYFK